MATTTFYASRIVGSEPGASLDDAVRSLEAAIYAALTGETLSGTQVVTIPAVVKATDRGAASGVASLNSSSKVVEDPANATATPTANKIVMSGADGKIAAGFLPSAAGAVFSGAHAYSTDSTAITNTPASISLDAEVYDTASFHDLATNPERMTIPSTGYYRLTGRLRVTGSAGDTVALKLAVSDGRSTFKHAQIIYDGVADLYVATIDISCDVYLTTGQYCYLQVWSLLGSGSMNLAYSGSLDNCIQVAFLGT